MVSTQSFLDEATRVDFVSALMAYASTFGANVQRLRKQAGLSQKALAKKLGVTQPQMSAWENDRFGTPTGDTLFRFAKAIGCTIEELLSGLDAEYDLLVNRHEETDTEGSSEGSGVTLQKSRTVADSGDVVPNHVPLEADASMNHRLPVPDPDLFDKVESVWRLLESRKSREGFVQEASDYLGVPRDKPRRKNNRR